MGQRNLTFVSIFVIFSLLFLIQTMVNSDLFETDRFSKPSDLMILSLFQVPQRRGSEIPADHIAFLSVGEILFITKQESDYRYSPNSCHSYLSDPQSPLGLRSRYDETGNCVPADEKWSSLKPEPNFGAFSNHLEQEYGVSASHTVSMYGQSEYTFGWRPPILYDNLEITVGLCLCGLTNSQKHRKLEPEWGLEGDYSRYPHPIVAHIRTIRESIEEKHLVQHYHVEQDKRDGMYYQGDQCDVNWRKANQEFQTLLKDLNAEKSRYWREQFLGRIYMFTIPLKE